MFMLVYITIDKSNIQVEKGCLNDLRDAKAALNKQAALVASVKQVLLLYTI